MHYKAKSHCVGQKCNEVLNKKDYMVKGNFCEKCIRAVLKRMEFISHQDKQEAIRDFRDKCESFVGKYEVD